MGRRLFGELQFPARPLSFCGLAKELSVSTAPAADPLFGAAWAAIGLARPTRPWTLPVVNGVAVAAILGLGVLWVYAVSQLMVSLGTVVVWTLVLIGLGILAMLTSRAVERDLGVQVERQSSLLATLSDLGEGLLITENGRFVVGNDAYVNLTGYTRDQLAAMPSLIELAPPEDRERLSTNLTKRLA